MFLSSFLQLSGPHSEGFDQKLQTVSLVRCDHLSCSCFSVIFARVLCCRSVCVFVHICLCSRLFFFVFLRALVGFIARYFPASATKEMLDEWRPLLCVFDVVMQKAISNMELFLPTIMPPEEHSQGFQ